MEKKRTLSVNGGNNELIPPQPPSSPKTKNSLNNIENNECNNNINNINNSGINNNNNTSTNINKNIYNSEDIDNKDNHQQKYYLLPSKMSSSQEFQSYITPNKNINNRNNDDNEGTIQNFTSRIFNSILMYMIRPFLVGASASFGISIGYVLFDICHNKLKLKWEGK
ncbi:hypothetical protein ACTFIU_003246 [Dictyostelium citrinum]